MLKTEVDAKNSIERNLNIINKFEKLKIPDLGIEEAYENVLNQFGLYLSMKSLDYERNKNNPPIVRDMPPVSG